MSTSTSESWSRVSGALPVLEFVHIISQEDMADDLMPKVVEDIVVEQSVNFPVQVMLDLAEMEKTISQRRISERHDEQCEERV